MMIILGSFERIIKFHLKINNTKNSEFEMLYFDLNDISILNENLNI